jgi:hypothetical protein
MALLGHVMDMVNRIRENESLRKARHDRYQKIKDRYSDKTQRENSFHDHETAVKEFNHLKQDLKFKLKRENRKSTFNIIIRILVVLAIIIILYFLFFE